MKVKMRELLQSVGTLQKLMTVQLPVKTSYRLNKNLRKISAELDDYEKTRVGLVERFEIPEDGVIEESKYGEFEAAINELLDEEVDIDIMTISPDDMGNNTMSVAEVGLVSFLFDDSAPSSQ